MIIIILYLIHSDEGADNSRKSANGRREIVVPPTPSKVLFSPGLRTDPTTGGALHEHSDEEEEEENIDENQLTEEEAPSTPTVSTSAAAEEEEVEDDCDEFNPYQFIAHLPPHSSVCILDKICLPALPGGAGKKQELMTLALDLDETLVHCTVEPIAKPDLVFPVK